MFRGEYVNGAGETEQAVDSVMIESPTGSGKTIMALLGCKTLQYDIPDLCVVWVAMRRNLLAQAAAENKAKGINVENIHFVSMFDKFPEDVVAERSAGKPILLVCDEAQHDAASSMAHLHNLIEPNWVLGMTATPFRTDNMKLCFQKVVKDAGIHQLIQEGYLSQYHHYQIPDWRPETVATHYLMDPKHWGKSAFYFKDLTLCLEFQQRMLQAGVDCEFVSGSSDRETQMTRFEKPVSEGGCDVLVNCMVLTEGWDYPALQTAWVRDSRKGPTMQMGGRVFRLHDDLPVKQMVQSGDTKWPFVKTAMPLMQYVWQGDDWKSLQVNPRLNQINQNARIAIATTDVELPEFIKKERGRGRSRVWRP
jgi:superfamily II DNA or RNA helicase